MAGEEKFDQEVVFKSIIGAEREPKAEGAESPAAQEKNKDRVQRSYFLDQNIDKALRRMALEEEKILQK